jgi:REP element-mobilizing transposase RayT
LRRRYGQHRLHFITCSCYQRLPLLASVRSKNFLVKVLAEVRNRQGFSPVGYVVMPEHIHLLISKPSKGTPSTLLQILKQRVSRRLRRRPRTPSTATQLTLRFGRLDPSWPHFWQPRLYDFHVRALLGARQKKLLESLQVRRETSLHAYEPCEAKIDRSSQGLALEYFSLLRKVGFRFDSHQSHPVIRLQHKVKSPALARTTGTRRAQSDVDEPENRYGVSTRSIMWRYVVCLRLRRETSKRPTG